MMKQWIVASTLAGLIGLAGCGGQYASSSTSTTVAPTAKNEGNAQVKDSKIDINRAALPFKVLKARGGQEVDPEKFYDDLAAAAGICLGETHPNPHDHWAQLHMLQEVINRRKGHKLALGMEMFQLPFQGVLDDYAAGRIDEKTMLSRTDWANRWGFDFALYRPLLDLAIKQEIPILALNIAAELKDKIKRHGIEGLAPSDRAKVPEIDLNDAEHKSWFEDLMADMGGQGAHGHGDASSPDDKEMARRIYLSQVLWDETMADTAARWIKGEAGRHVVIIAGSGHCHDSAIVRRMRRRGAGAVLSIRPVMQSKVADELASPQTDYLFVLIPPH